MTEMLSVKSFEVVSFSPSYLLIHQDAAAFLWKKKEKHSHTWIFQDSVSHPHLLAVEYFPVVLIALFGLLYISSNKTIDLIGPVGWKSEAENIYLALSLRKKGYTSNGVTVVGKHFHFYQTVIWISPSNSENEEEKSTMFLYFYFVKPNTSPSGFVYSKHTKIYRNDLFWFLPLCIYNSLITRLNDFLPFACVQTKRANRIINHNFRHVSWIY